MWRTPSLWKAAAASSKTSVGARESSIKSLALSVHFRHPALGMKDYEILSRASAFLLSVDPPSSSSSLAEEEDKGTYRFLHDSKRQRDNLLRRLDYRGEPAGGPPRHAQDLGWLEFCPAGNRPRVHCVASSHVLAPWKWKNYYPQDWLQQVQQEHCTYSLEVYDPASPEQALAKFALNPYAIHHPNDLDVALIHLKQEETVLQHMQDLGVEILHLQEHDDQFEKGQELIFDGYEITEETTTEETTLDDIVKQSAQQEDDDDTRVFVPYQERGWLSFATPERFLASTNDRVLPEGLCGGPVLCPEDGRVCGVVEGIVPLDFHDKRIAGAASFLPTPLLRGFIEHAEQTMLQTILPPKLYDKVVDLKQGQPLSSKTGEMQLQSDDDYNDEGLMEKAFQDMVAGLRQHHTTEEVNAIVGTIDRERQEVLDILQRQGGDVDEIIARVRQKTRQVQQDIMQAQVRQDDNDEARDDQKTK